MIRKSAGMLCACALLSLVSARGASAFEAPVPFDSLTTERYRATAKALAAAVATDDAKGFRALHADSGWARADDWWKAMLANQKKSFGRVVRVVGPLRGSIAMGRTGLGISPDGVAILLRLERGVGAAMNFTIDATGKIATSSLWVQHELADAAPDAEVLWERPRKVAPR